MLVLTRGFRIHPSMLIRCRLNASASIMRGWHVLTKDAFDVLI